MKKLSIVVIMIAVPLLISAQGRKDFRDGGIKTTNVYKYKYDAGKEIKTLDATYSYDTKGNEVERIEYDDYGKVTKHEKSTYNDKNDRLTLAEFNAAGKLLKTTKSSYNSEGRKTQEEEYDSAGKLKKKWVYHYEGAFKTERLCYDAAGKLTQKKTYIYSK